MATKTKDKKEKRNRRHKRIRTEIFGTSERPRLSVFKSNTFIYGQVIDDSKGETLVAANTRNLKKEKGKSAAKEAGKLLAKAAIGKKVKSVVFDRGGHIYIGKVREFAEGAREGGLEF